MLPPQPGLAAQQNRKGVSDMSKSYESPAIKVLGTLRELTLRNKNLGKPSDGDFLEGFGTLKNHS
jgi:hypothetical protein